MSVGWNGSQRVSCPVETCISHLHFLCLQALHCAFKREYIKSSLTIYVFKEKGTFTVLKGQISLGEIKIYSIMAVLKITIELTINGIYFN